MGRENDFDRNDNDQYVRTKIQAFAKERYPDTSSQGFYRAFRDLDITNKTSISNSFGAGYKEKIIEISNNDAKVITHLRGYPN